MPPSIAACLHGHHVLWILASTQGKDDRRVQMTKVMFLYRTNLPCSVKTRPWHIWVNGSPKLPQDLQFLLLAEHHLSSGGTLKLVLSRCILGSPHKSQQILSLLLYIVV